ncbi:MAG TPA: acyl carrier protein [Nevskiaceae bacterium]|nr:acyl carrier protein [Nevskiaceae bacterium]
MGTQEIFARLRDLLVELFEVEPAKITLEANLYKDLDIDSIDAVDLIIKLREITGRRVQPEAFKQVRTVGDVVNVVYGLTQAAA